MYHKLSTSLLAEFIGTFALIFIGAGAGALGLGGLVGVAFAHGLVVLGFAYAYGHISGTHINPAVTLGVWAAGNSGQASVPGGLAIGLTLTFCILMGGPLTGASLNPARSIGPALATGNFSDLWVYLVGPALGGVAAGLLYKTVYEEERSRKK